jgi:protein arginine N-methyltransferase 1
MCVTVDGNTRRKLHNTFDQHDDGRPTTEDRCRPNLSTRDGDRDGNDGKSRRDADENAGDEDCFGSTGGRGSKNRRQAAAAHRTTALPLLVGSNRAEILVYSHAMYSVLDYGAMVCEAYRTDAYSRAIASVVKPGSTVLDLGAGTGILSLLAARAGARRVHAVETNPAIFLLPDLAVENGLEDRIVIHPMSSFEVALDEKVDVIVSDLRGSFPLHGRGAEAIRDARTRFLAPGGALLPVRDRLFVGVVESPDAMRRLDLVSRGFASCGLTARAARLSVLNTAYRDCDLSALNANDLVTTSEAWATLDYATFGGGVLEQQVVLTARRAGVAHGLAVWFEATVHGDFTFANPPGHQGVYARTFLPLLEAVQLRAGDRVDLTLRVDERGERWGWDTIFIDGSNGSRKAALRQATFLGMPTSPDALLRASSSFKPIRSPRGDRLARILEAMDGTRTTDEIERLTVNELDASVTRDEVRDAVTTYAR